MFHIIVLLICSGSASAAVNYGHALTTTETSVSGDKPKVILAQAGNFSVAFVPLITLLANAFPKIVNRFRPSQITTGRELKEQPHIPAEFHGSNPCIDSILIRKKYPGSDCHFYECQLYEPATASCRVQVIEEESSSIVIDPLSVRPKNSVFRISECLAIRVFKCSIGYIYSEVKNLCVKHFKNHAKLTCPS